MKIFILSFISGGTIGYILTKMNVNVYFTLGVCFCIGTIIGWFIKWK